MSESNVKKKSSVKTVTQRKKVVKVQLHVQAVNSSGQIYGPEEIYTCDTLDSTGTDYRITSIYWGDFAVNAIFAPYYSTQDRFLTTKSPIVDDRIATAGEKITPDMIRNWWRDHKRHFALYKGKNSQPTYPRYYP